MYLRKLAPEMAYVANDMEIFSKLGEYSHENPLQMIIQYNLLTDDSKFCGKKIADFVLDVDKRLIVKKVINKLEQLGLSLIRAFSISPLSTMVIDRLTSDQRYIIKRLQIGLVTTFEGLFKEYAFIKKDCSRLCCACGKPSAPKKCSACFTGWGINARYCNDICQLHDWNMPGEGHKHYCFKTNPHSAHICSM
jgi:hypothetical protein